MDRQAIATFTFPTRVLFGEGAVGQLSSELHRLGVGRPLFVSDPGVVAAGILTSFFDVFPEAPLFSDVRTNPSEVECLGGIALYRDRDCDGLVAIGGGSPIDVAKAIRLLASHPGDLADYDVTTGGMARITSNMPPMLAAPTTAGTGSEVGRGMLIQLPQTGRKTAIVSPHLLPSVSICDPTLTYGLNPQLTAATGMDALTHAIESYLSPMFHPICDGIAAEALRYLARGLEAAVRNGRDAGARRAMMAASLMAGISFHKGLGAVHALAHALGSEGRAHHGTINAILLPHVLRFNRPASEPRLMELASLLGLGRTVDTAGHLITLTELLRARLPLPNRLSELDGLDRARIPRYAELASLDHCLWTNPRPATLEDLIQILELAW